MGLALRDPSTGYPTLLVLALLCGLGGANFSSSMANISFFFPKAKKGFATGMNAGIGNLGVSIVQFVTPLVISASVFGAFAGAGQSYDVNGVEHSIWLQNAGFIWVPFIVISALAAWFGMNDIADAKPRSPNRPSYSGASTTGSCACCTSARSVRSSAFRRASRC